MYTCECVLGGQEAPPVLELDLLSVVSWPRRAGVGNQAQVLHQSRAALNCRDISPAPGHSHPLKPAVTHSNISSITLLRSKTNSHRCAWQRWTCPEPFESVFKALTARNCSLSQIKILRIWASFRHVCMCTKYVLRAQGGQKRVLDPWDWSYR